MKIKLLVLCMLVCVSSVHARSGGWFFELFKDNGHCEYEREYYCESGYAYRMGSNYNNGNYYQYAPREVYTPWVRYQGRVPEHVISNPRAVIRDYGCYYDLCWRNYSYQHESKYIYQGLKLKIFQWQCSSGNGWVWQPSLYWTELVGI